MFYRIDYLVAVLIVGFLSGFSMSKATENTLPGRLAQAFYVATAVLLVLRAGLFACTILMSHVSLWAKLGGIAGDTLNFLFATLFGLAARRKDVRELLTSPTILSALSMFLAFIFALAGIGKAFSMISMTEFFIQSGYSLSFLKFIVIAEIFGGLGLLVHWAVLPSLIGLTIDMFGAVLTHVHNGDPLNDSTGAIGMLIRLIIFGVLWQMRQRDAAPSRSVGNSIRSVGATACLCFLIALGGSVTMRDLSGAATSAPSR